MNAVPDLFAERLFKTESPHEPARSPFIAVFFSDIRLKKRLIDHLQNRYKLKFTLPENSGLIIRDASPGL